MTVRVVPYTLTPVLVAVLEVAGEKCLLLVCSC